MIDQPASVGKRPFAEKGVPAVPWKAEERNGVVEVVEGQRFVRIPGDFVLVGDRIVIRQEKDGVISIHPATDDGRKALENFTPFGDWTEADWKRFESYDWSKAPWVRHKRKPSKS